MPRSCGGEYAGSARRSTNGALEIAAESDGTGLALLEGDEVDR